MTASHSPKSLISHPRPTFTKKATPPTETRNHAKDKSRLAAWFVSNCHTQSRRETYAQEMLKYMPIDIYGKCGNLTCDKVKDNCGKLLLQYKFYLAFENSLCMDYITEKFTRTFQKPLVGVVLGAADYKKYAPQETYIDVRDFSSPRALAEYLLYLAKNDTAYNSIIHKKKQYDVSFKNEETHICGYM